MRTYVSYILILFLMSCGKGGREDAKSGKATLAPDLFGAWKYSFENDANQQVEVILTVSGDYFSQASYVVKPPQFLNTYGGSWDLEGDQLIFFYEYDVEQPFRVGSSDTLNISWEKDQLKMAGQVWERVDDGTPGALADAWLITGRERNGEMRFWTPEARKTMKILSGTRFQWIAYNTADGGFFGTGGGTYTTRDGTYTENIEFFSRDSSRVGASLEFQFELDSGQWHHRGLSSRGDPIYEVWTPRSMLDQ